MGEEYKFQHDVPQFYLRNFRGLDDKLHCLHVDSNRRFEVYAGDEKSINIAASDYFYDESEEKILERGLGELESDWAESVRKTLIHQDFSRLSDEVKADLILFVTLQYIRTRATREELLEGLLDEEDSLPSDMAEFLHSNSGREAHIVIMKTVTELLSERLYDHGSFCLYENRSQIPFITSDNPVVHYHHESPDKYDYRDAIGVGGEDWELSLPLTPHYCLSIRCIHYFDDNDRKVSVGENVVYRQNTLQLVQASDVAVCGNKEYKGITNIW